MKTSGVYKITCIPTGQYYIGSSSNLELRKRCHFSKLRNNNHNCRMQEAYNKYGKEQFTWEVIELCLAIELPALEQKYLDCMNPKDSFNVLSYATVRPLDYHPSVLTLERLRVASTGRKASDETRRLQSIASKGRKRTAEEIEKHRLAITGRKLTPEHKMKIGLSSVGRKHSPEDLIKMRNGQLGRKHSPETRQKIINSRMGLKLGPQSKEWIRKRVEATQATKDRQAAEERDNRNE